MLPTYQQFLENEYKLFSVAKNPNPVTQRFFQLRKIPASERDRLDQAEYETLEKVFRARWRAQTADAKAKTLLNRIEADTRKADTHAKILVGVAALQLARHDLKLREDLLTLSRNMPSADHKTLARLFTVQTATHAQREG